MANNLIKNSRFKTGSKVDIHYAPVLESNTINIVDSTAAGKFQITATLADDISAEISSSVVSVGDICAFSFGVGVISTITAPSTVIVDFPNSMFPDDNVMRYVGTEFQHVLFFDANERILPNMQVNKYVEKINSAEYGYAKVVYNLQTEASLLLTPTRRVDDGELAQVLISKGFVLKSCDVDDYDINTGGWMPDFPIELSGTSIDPIYRRAFLQKRLIESKGRKAKSTMEFILIG